MLEMMVIRKEGFVMMHMVRSPVVFDPYALNSPDPAVYSCLEAEG